MHGKVPFEKLIAPDQLALSPMREEEAAKRGRPSCWGVTPDGELVVLRYAESRLHEAADIDVTSADFLVGLRRFAKAFAEEGLHETLEINVADRLFPPGEGQVTKEETDEVARFQTVTFTDMPQEVLDGDWTTVACWTPSTLGEPLVTGICTTLADPPH
jgi:hypothetical protein